LGEGTSGLAEAAAAAGVYEDGGAPFVDHLCLAAIGRGPARFERGDHLVVDAENDPRDAVRLAFDDPGVTLLTRGEGDELSSLDDLVSRVEQADRGRDEVGRTSLELQPVAVGVVVDAEAERR